MSAITHEVNLIEPTSEDPQIDVDLLPYEGSSKEVNRNASHCFLVLIQSRERRILFTILIGPAYWIGERRVGHSALERHYENNEQISWGMQTAGGGMLWTTRDNDITTLNIGSRSIDMGAVPAPIIELLKQPVADFLRNNGAIFEDVKVCPEGWHNRIWNQEIFADFLSQTQENVRHASDDGPA